MPDLGPLGRGGARRRTRKRMNAVDGMNQSKKPSQETEAPITSDNLDKLKKLAKLLTSKGVISQEEYDLLFE